MKKGRSKKSLLDNCRSLNVSARWNVAAAAALLRLYPLHPPLGVCPLVRAPRHHQAEGAYTYLAHCQILFLTPISVPYRKRLHSIFVPRKRVSKGRFLAILYCNSSPLLCSDFISHLLFFSRFNSPLLSFAVSRKLSLEQQPPPSTLEAVSRHVASPTSSSGPVSLPANAAAATTETTEGNKRCLSRFCVSRQNLKKHKNP